MSRTYVIPIAGRVIKPFRTRCCDYEFNPLLKPGEHRTHEDVNTDHGCPVFWNEFNGVIQCHNCGTVYVPDGLEPMIVAMERVNKINQDESERATDSSTDGSQGA